MSNHPSLSLIALAAALCAMPAGAQSVAPDGPGASRSRAPGSGPIEELTVEGRRGSMPTLDDTASTGSRLGLTLRELPASVAIVTQPQIQLYGARTALEAIESAVGMSGGVGVGSIPSYATRGFSGSDVTIMRDGIRQNTSSQSSRPLDSFLFDRIEILKGPASLLHGEGAIGGAVNYVSKEAGRERDGELLVNMGSYGHRRSAAGFGGPLGDALAYRIDVSASRADGFVDGNEERYDAAGGELRWSPSADTTVRFAFTGLRDRIESYYGTPVIYDAVIDADGNEAVRPASTTTDRLVNARIDPRTRRLNYNIEDNFSNATNTFTRVIVDHRLSDRWTMRNETYAATQRLDWRNVERNTWNPATELVDRGSFFLIYRRDLQVGNRIDFIRDADWGARRNRLLIGMLVDRNDQDRNSGQVYPRLPSPVSVPLTGFDPGLGPDAEAELTVNVVTRTAAVYLENALDITPRLTLVGGLRRDDIEIDRVSFVGDAPFTKSYGPTTGRLGMIYEASDRISVYVSHSRAAQPVSQLVSLTAAQDEFSLQKGRQHEAGVKASLLPGYGGELTVALFDIEKNDLLTSTFVDGERINSQIGAQVSQGIEVSFGTFLPSGWRLDANFARTWKAEYEEFNENLGTGVISRAGNTPANVPKTTAGFFASRSFGPWSVAGSVYHVGERQANTNNGIQLPAYTKIDASVTRRWDTLAVTLRGRNLTDELYAQSAGGGGLMWRLAEPRTWELGLRYEF